MKYLDSVRSLALIKSYFELSDNISEACTNMMGLTICISYDGTSKSIIRKAETVREHNLKAWIKIIYTTKLVEAILSTIAKYIHSDIFSREFHLLNEIYKRKRSISETTEVYENQFDVVVVDYVHH